MRRLSTAICLASLLALGACASDMPAPAKSASTAAGTVLVDARGMTLYTFDRDGGGKSACNAQCATNWPPLMAPADVNPGHSWAMVTRDPLMPPTFVPSMSGSGPWTVITRDDGGKQWAYMGKPVYAFARDQKPGDTTGDGFLNGAWHVARP